MLSDYDLRLDALMVDDDRRRLRVFEGAGVASTWTLELPQEVNDLDYDAITDVRLTFTYEGRFDPDLRDTVIQELATRPQANERQRPLPLRWLYPDAFFAFYETGELEITLAAADFPATETQTEDRRAEPDRRHDAAARADGIVLRVKVPGTRGHHRDDRRRRHGGRGRSGRGRRRAACSATGRSSCVRPTTRRG